MMTDTYSNSSNADVPDDVSEDSHRPEEILYPLNEEVQVPNTNGNLFKTVLTEGTGQRPAKGSAVSVHYVGRLENGTEFDSSRKRGALFEFRLHKGEVIKGWDHGVATMKVGEKCLLRCLPEYAYGAAGHPPTIPPSSTLVFEVELFSWKKEEDISEDKTKTLMKRTLLDGVGFENPSIESKLTIDLHVYAGGSDEQMDALVKEMGSEGSPERSKGEKNADDGAALLSRPLWVGKEWEVEIGVTELPPYLEECLRKMRVEEVALFRVSPLCLSSEGSSTFRIPPLSLLSDPSEKYALIYRVEIHRLSTVKTWDFDGMEKVNQGMERKNRANSFFQSGSYERAVAFYRRALEFVGEDYGFNEEEKKAAVALRVVIWGNLSQTLLLQNELYPAEQKYRKNATEALALLRKALEVEPQNVKNLFRFGKALNVSKEWDEAKKALQRLLEVEPENADARALLEKVIKSIKEYEKSQKSLFSKMFSK